MARSSLFSVPSPQETLQNVQSSRREQVQSSPVQRGSDLGTIRERVQPLARKAGQALKTARGALKEATASAMTGTPAPEGGAIDELSGTDLVQNFRRNVIGATTAVQSFEREYNRVYTEPLTEDVEQALSTLQNSISGALKRLKKKK